MIDSLVVKDSFLRGSPIFSQKVANKNTPLAPWPQMPCPRAAAFNFSRPPRASAPASDKTHAGKLGGWDSGKPTTLLPWGISENGLPSSNSKAYFPSGFATKCLTFLFTATMVQTPSDKTVSSKTLNESGGKQDPHSVSLLIGQKIGATHSLNSSPSPCSPPPLPTVYFKWRWQNRHVQCPSIIAPPPPPHLPPKPPPPPSPRAFSSDQMGRLRARLCRTSPGAKPSASEPSRASGTHQAAYIGQGGKGGGGVWFGGRGVGGG